VKVINEVYVFGGTSASERGEVYNLINDTWTELPTVPIHLNNYVSCASVQNKVFTTCEQSSDWVRYDIETQNYNVYNLDLKKNWYKRIIATFDTIIIVTDTQSKEIDADGTEFFTFSGHHLVENNKGGTVIANNFVYAMQYRG
jgi:hypothetical protein